MHLQTLFWGGVPRHHHRVHCTAQIKTILVALVGQAGLGSLWILLPLLGTLLFWVTSSLAPRSSWPSVSVFLHIHPQGSTVLLLDFCFEACAYLLTVLPPRSRATHDSLHHYNCAIPLLSSCWHGIWGSWDILVQIVKLMPKLYLANKLVFKIILTALAEGVNDKIKGHVDCR